MNKIKTDRSTLRGPFILQCLCFTCSLLCISTNFSSISNRYSCNVILNATKIQGRLDKEGSLLVHLCVHLSVHPYVLQSIIRYSSLRSLGSSAQPPSRPVTTENKR